MPPACEFITFDCYGTLIDWESGIRKAFLAAAEADGAEIDQERIIPLYSEIEPVVEQEHNHRYRDVLAETAQRVAAVLGWRLTDNRSSFLADSLPHWQPFADTNRALETLQSSRIGLGILSNIDDDLLSATQKHFTVSFDLIITAQQIGSYKPAPGHFLAARERLAGTRWIHAAQSNFHDIVPTNRLGIPNAWINRKREMALPGGNPSLQFEGLAAFAAGMTEPMPS